MMRALPLGTVGKPNLDSLNGRSYVFSPFLVGFMKLVTPQIAATNTSAITAPTPP